MSGLISLIAVFGYINHRYIRLPDTVGITVVGLAFSLFAALLRPHFPNMATNVHQLATAIDFPELVFHGMLGILLFAGSLHVNFNEIVKHKAAIGLLSTVGVLVSTVFIGLGAQTLFNIFHYPMPLIYCMLFGALISPTDPVAVLGVLKHAGVSKGLKTKITGEALFNDGTAVVAFLVLLGIATGGPVPSGADIGGMLLKEVLGGCVLGLTIGYLAFFMLKGMESYPVEILTTVALATGGYAFAEALHVSAPLAVVVMGLVIGNHGVLSAMSEKTREHLFSFWKLIDSLLTLMLFGLIGLEVVDLDLRAASLAAAVLAVPLVLLGRFVSVGLPKGMLYAFGGTVPHSVKIMTWGGLRGGISIALALSLPPLPQREMIIIATYAVVLFSLLVQAPTLGKVLKALKEGDAALETTQPTLAQP